MNSRTVRARTELHATPVLRTSRTDILESSIRRRACTDESLLGCICQIQPCMCPTYEAHHSNGKNWITRRSSCSIARSSSSCSCEVAKNPAMQQCFRLCRGGLHHTRRRRAVTSYTGQCSSRTPDESVEESSDVAHSKMPCGY